MTAITQLRGTQLYIKVEDDASPQVYAHPCLINAKRGIQFQSSTKELIVPDCDNPDDPAWSKAIKDALKAKIDGAGMLDNKAATISFYDSWFRAKTPKSVQVWLGTMGYWRGDFHLTDWGISGDRGENATATVTLDSDGALDSFVAA